MPFPGAIVDIQASESRLVHRLPGLDGMRMVAVSLIVVYHANYRDGFATGTWLAGPATRANFGVSIFFVLSGFLITHLLIREEEQTGRVGLRDYFLRRMIRILPPAYFYIAVVTLLAGARLVTMPWSNLLPALFLYVDYVPTSYVTAHYWTLSVEEQFYLTWPLAFVALRTNRSRLNAAAVAIIAAPFWRQSNILFLGASSVNWWRFDLNYDSLLIGCELALLMQWRRAEVILSSRWLTCDFSVIAFVALLMLSFSDRFEGIPKIVPFLATIRVTCVAGVINRVVRPPRGWIAMVFELPPVVWIGRLSYSLYLWHVLFTMDVSAPPWLAPRFPLNLIPILLASMFSYFVIEKPLQKWRARFRRETPGVLLEVDEKLTDAPPVFRFVR